MSRKRQVLPKCKSNRLTITDPVSPTSPYRHLGTVVLQEDFKSLSSEAGALSVEGDSLTYRSQDVALWKDGEHFFQRVTFTPSYASPQAFKKAAAWVEDHPDFTVGYSWGSSTEWYAFEPASQVALAAFNKVEAEDEKLVKKIKAFKEKVEASAKKQKAKEREAQKKEDEERAAHAGNVEDVIVQQALTILRKRGANITISEGGK